VNALLIVAAVICVIVGVTAPWAAPQVAAVLMGTIAATYVIARVRGLGEQLPRAEDRPLRAPAPRPPGAPADLLLLRNDVEANRSSRMVVGDPVQSFLANIAAARLRDRHGVNPRDPAALARARPLLSDQLWTLISQRIAAEPVRSELRYDALPALIDEVERL
jgi:hypothetical protein